MALNTTVNNFCDGSIVLKDATGSPITVTAQYSNGDFGTSDIGQALREVTHYEARGVITSVRYTTVKPPTFTFTCQMTGFTNATAFAMDAVRKAGAFASGVSTLGANAEVWAVTIVWSVEGSNFGGADSTMTATNCYGTVTAAEGDPNSLSFSFTCYGTVTFA